MSHSAEQGTFVDNALSFCACEQLVTYINRNTFDRDEDLKVTRDVTIEFSPAPTKKLHCIGSI